jgi:catalase
MYLLLHNEFAFDTPDFERLAKRRDVWTDERLEQAIEYTRFKLNEGKVTVSPRGYLFKALEGNYRIGEADRRMASIKAKQLEDDKKDRRSRDTAQAHLQASIQVQNDTAKAKMSEEIQAGREYFESVDASARKELCHSFVSQLIPQRLIEKQGLSRESVSAENILTVNRVVADAFCAHVYAKMKKARAGSRI